MVKVVIEATEETAFEGDMILKSDDTNVLCYNCDQLYEWKQLEERKFKDVVSFFYIVICRKCFEGEGAADSFIKLEGLKTLEEQISDFKEKRQELIDDIKDLKSRKVFLKEELLQNINFRNLLITSFCLFSAYAVFHGHRLGIDCWLCKYRGTFMIILASSFAFTVLKDD